MIIGIYAKDWIQKFVLVLIAIKMIWVGTYLDHSRNRIILKMLSTNSSW